MNVHVIDTGLFKLDGGPMFGVVPKSMWQKLNPPDENNMCTWAMRSLLIEDGARLILVDTGMGDKQDEKFRSHFYPHGEDTLLKSLNAKGYAPEDITDVILTHLHFDHCGGAVYRKENGILETTFKNATYWSNDAHWDWAANPNERERNSFLKENFYPIKESGQLKMAQPDSLVTAEFSLPFAYGHTESMMMPKIKYKNTSIFFASDLIPSSHHVPMPYVLAYDVRPMETLKEKAFHLETVLNEKQIVFFQHDPVHECGVLKKNDAGRIMIDTVGKLSDFI